MDGFGFPYQSNQGGAIVTAWISPRPVGVTDWVLTLALCVLAVPVLLTFGLFALALRAVLKVGESQ